MIVTTVDWVPGYDHHVLGLVVGSRPTFGTTYGEQIKDLHGHARPDVHLRYEEIRLGAVAYMVERAAKLGANAVVGVRFDHHEINATWKELCAYGTAVILEPSP